MERIVFISHSSKDKVVADAIVHRLEENGIRCWIAPRAITKTDWAGSIMDALFLRAVPTFLLNLLAFAPFVLLLGRWGGSGPALMGGGPRSIGRRGAKHIDTRGL